jgi:hypothetical protein
MRAITFFGLGLLLLAQGAAGAVQDRGQQKCLAGFEKGMARVAKAAGQSSVQCLRDAAKGRAAFGGCVADDPGGKLSRAETKLRDAEARLCGASPAEFGVTSADLGMDGVRSQREALLEALFGTPYGDAASSEKRTASCQAEALRSAAKVQDAHWKAAAAAGKRAAKAGAAGAVDFEQAVRDALERDPRLLKAELKAQQRVAARCSGVEASALPGRCGEGNSGACVATAAACHFCQAWNEATDTAFDCDVYDNGVSDATCASTGGTLYVAASGDDGGEGTRELPLATLAAALEKAGSEGFGRIRMAAGTYAIAGERLVNGVSIEGGFDPASWAANAGETLLLSRQPVGLVADGVTAPTVLENLTIESADGADGSGSARSGESSYAVLANASDGLAIRSSILRAGDGGAGADGGVGFTGATARGGSAGGSCGSGECSSPRSGGSGGSSICSQWGPARGGSGGRGGDIPTPGIFSGNGLRGSTSSSGSAGGGNGGTECFSILPVICTAGVGNPGEPGPDASPPSLLGIGGDGSGVATPLGWVGSAGGFGVHGNPGSGGGGGGGGGGRAIQPFILDAGAGGGGGGEGGCAGGGGSGGGAGGGSFGLYAFGSHITLEDVTAESGRGGSGGDGGPGGPGGRGGNGGAGGTSIAGDGGRGGNGGRGSEGTQGGGGGGGVSFAVYAAGGAITQRGESTLSEQGGGAGGSPGGDDGAAGRLGGS